jgi:hypothetical protein
MTQVVYFPVDAASEPRRIPDVLGAWQEWVGGMIQFVELGDGLVMIVNENGQEEQPPSHWTYPTTLAGFGGTPVFGPFVVARWQWDADGDRAVDLTAHDLVRIQELFP